MATPKSANSTPYQTSPGSIRDAQYKENPLTQIVITGQGKESHPVPPAPPGPWRYKRPAPRMVKAPGASGTI